MSGFSATFRREALQALVGGRAWSLAIAMAALTGLPLIALSSMLRAAGVRFFLHHERP